MSIWNAPCNPADEQAELCQACEEREPSRDRLCAECLADMHKHAHGPKRSPDFERVGAAVYQIGSSEPVHTFPTETEAVMMHDLLEAAVPPWEALETVFAKRTERRCRACETWTRAPFQICLRCVETVYKPNRMWCDIHGACWQDFCAGCKNGPTKGKR